MSGDVDSTARRRPLCPGRLDVRSKLQVEPYDDPHHLRPFPRLRVDDLRRRRRGARGRPARPPL